jgi:hypothetical protein
MHRVGLVSQLGEKFASGEGIQDALHLTPAMLFQTDEIDGLLQSINKAQDARHENIMGTLLTMYSAANSIYPMRRKAGKEPPGVIDQPCLVVYGTAIPTHYYQALSERMLTNGFFARMLIVESGSRSEGQEPGIIDPPGRIIDTARWWSEFSPGTGNLEHWHPQPRIVEADDEARSLLADARRTSETEYAAAEARGEPRMVRPHLTRLHLSADHAASPPDRFRTGLQRRADGRPPVVGRAARPRAAATARRRRAAAQGSQPIDHRARLRAPRLRLRSRFRHVQVSLHAFQRLSLDDGRQRNRPAGLDRGCTSAPVVIP